MKLLEGKRISEKILRSLRDKIRREKLKPALVVILIGDNKASEIYVKLKKKAAKKIGITFRLFKFKKTASENKIIGKIRELNSNKKISGIIVQLPLPKKFNTQRIINSIEPKKDVDGFHPKNVKVFLSGRGGFWPVFPHAIWKLIESSRKEVKGRQAIIIGNSKKFGEIMRFVLKKGGIGSSYVLCRDMKINAVKIKKAKVVISACGQPGLITGDVVKKGAVIIDGGITKKVNKVFGDVDFASAKDRAGFLSPVPGGVGPVTIACLLENVYLASKKQSQ